MYRFNEVRSSDHWGMRFVGRIVLRIIVHFFHLDSKSSGIVFFTLTWLVGWYSPFVMCLYQFFWQWLKNEWSLVSYHLMVFAVTYFILTRNTVYEINQTGGHPVKWMIENPCKVLHGNLAYVIFCSSWY